MKQKHKILAILLAAIHILCSLFYESVFFLQRTTFVSLCRVMTFILLFFVYLSIIYIWVNRRKTRIKSGVIWGGVYLIILMALFLCVYPGSWRGGDEFVILSTVKAGALNYWHHYLTYIFYTISLILIPVPAAVPFFQMLISSAVVGYILSWIQEENSHRNYFAVLICFLPFVTLPVLDSIFYPMRMTVYAFLELLVHFKIYRFTQEKKISCVEMCTFSIIIGIVSVWRTEGIFYIIIACIIIFFCQKIDKQKRIQWGGFTLLCCIIIYLPQGLGRSNMVEGNASNYNITAVIRQIVPLIDAEIDNNSTSNLIDDVDRVLSVNVIAAGLEKGWDGTSLYWKYKELGQGELIRTGYNEDDYVKFEQAYIKLILKYKSIFASERMEVFMKSMPGVTLQSVPAIFESQSNRHIQFRENNFANTPLNKSLRMEVLRFLAAEKLPPKVRFLIWCVIPQILGAIVISAISVFRRDATTCLLACAIWGRALIVFLTAPASYFMYYFSVFLIGLFWFCYWLEKKLFANNCV